MCCRSMIHFSRKDQNCSFSSFEEVLELRRSGVALVVSVLPLRPVRAVHALIASSCSIGVAVLVDDGTLCSDRG